MIEILKKDMINQINELNLENSPTQIKLLDKQINLIESLQKIHEFKAENNIENENLLSNSETGCPKNEYSEEEIKEKRHIKHIKKDVDQTAYRFERKIRGGAVTEIEGFVPEGVIRKLGLEHGDMVYATPMETPNPNSNHFQYELAEKGDENDVVDRIQYNFCSIKKEAGRLVIDKSEETGEFIRYQDNLYTIILHERDVIEFKLKEGDLIDIAYPTNKIEVAKVLWKHPLESLTMETVNKTLTQVSGKTEQKEKIIYRQSLEGKNVLIIGNEPKKNLYKFSIEQRGGTFLWGDAKNDLTRLEALVRKSDVCVFLLSVSGHVGMEHIKQMCKDYDVSFETTWSNGKSSVIRLAEEV